MTLLISSHHLAELERTASHLALIHRGKVLRQAPIEDFLGGSALLEVRGGQTTNPWTAVEVDASTDVATVFARRTQPGHCPASP